MLQCRYVTTHYKNYRIWHGSPLAGPGPTPIQCICICHGLHAIVSLNYTLLRTCTDIQVMSSVVTMVQVLQPHFKFVTMLQVLSPHASSGVTMLKVLSPYLKSPCLKCCSLVTMLQVLSPCMLKVLQPHCKCCHHASSVAAMLQVL